MRTTNLARRALATTGAAVVVAATLLLVGPLTLATYAAAGADVLVDRYGTTWIALAGVVLLAATLVRRGRRHRPATATATTERPRLTVVHAVGQS